ncbi:hypothetical protein MRB53_031880 [Persea americana]|uniref:Uncharacterized protein n=1 Tax=Persea americana TaxID=3435 RepID=A0ACC2KQ92_PERAE|nr:hypothetical protein MRB53_031880 [Persea americana]
MHFLSTGPCQRTFGQFWNELLQHQLLPRRYHAWYSRIGLHSGDEDDNGLSLPLSYNKLVERYPHVEKDHLVKLLKQLMLRTSPPLRGMVGGNAPTAADVPTLLGAGSFSLLESDRRRENKTTRVPGYLRWPHMKADQVRGLSLREIGGGFTKHHRAPSIRAACYAIAKPSTMVQKMQIIKTLRGHQNSVYCATFDRTGRYVITGSDDRLVKIWSMETGFCLSSCRGHEGDITDLAVSSNSALVASSSNDCVIRVWRLPDGLPISVLRGHTATVTAIAFSPRPSAVYQLLSSSDDGTCRIWDARYSHFHPRIYIPKPPDAVAGKSNDPSPSTGQPSHTISCCAFNANGTVFVSGGSDTYARVWNAVKCNTEDTAQPIHEMDVLSGHEHDVTYVQFSCCAVASRSSTADSSKEDNLPKFKNSWFTHDNIVTCSRDGSAIIWIPRSRRSHSKVGRWTRAYHLKVPPPPMPPQQSRGGPRQRFLPTPRGVNMIVWSLDNRFVLAAIMDCRICVWNAVDGSLVHSLTGHSDSTYVLDVHPFNPRIAMSAGYDGKTIVWDIWEGTPVRVYETGDSRLVDGKFSPDGTSIVLSDHIGQIYILASGQGESQKDAQYDQFFLGDYRPLIQDTHGNVLDQETQLPPYRRNIQDLLCDSSMIPYPEPYQSMFQQRRLGALGIEWHPPSVRLAVGPADGQDFQMPVFADMDRWIEPLPEIDIMDLVEQENEVQSDDTDSEYNVTDECSSEGDQRNLSTGSSGDPECSAEDSDVDHSSKERLRRSKRKKRKTEVEVMTSSGRRVKRRNLDERDGTLSRNNRTKKLKYAGAASRRRKSSTSKSSRPQRLAARNALNLFSRITGASTDGEDEDGSESNLSESESTLPDSNIQSSESDRSMQKRPVEEDAYFDECETSVKPAELGSQTNVENRRRLVFKLPVRDSKKILPLENSKLEYHEGSSKSPSESTDLNQTCSSQEPSQNSGGSKVRERTKPVRVEDHPNLSSRYRDNKIRWGEVKARTSKRLRLGDASAIDVCPTTVGLNGNNATKNDVNGHLKSEDENALVAPLSKGKELASEYECNSLEAEEFPSNGHLQTSSSSPVACNGSGNKFEAWHLDRGCKDQAGMPECRGYDEPLESDDIAIGDRNSPVLLCKNDTDYSQEAEENIQPVTTRLRIRSKRIIKEPQSPSSELKFVAALEDWRNSGCDLMSKSPTQMQNGLSGVPEEDECTSSDSGKLETPVNRSKNSESSILQDSENKMFSTVYKRSKSYRTRTNAEGTEESIQVANNHNMDLQIDFPEPMTNGIRRTRSMGINTTAREQNPSTSNCKLMEGHGSAETSRNAEKFALNGREELLWDDWKASSRTTVGLRSARTRKDVHYDSDLSPQDRRKTHHSVRKPSWLMLLEHEDSYRYIPQQGDEVAYLRQGHQEYTEWNNSREVGPWRSLKGNIRDVEFCKVEGLDYSTLPGSGESCCKLTLKFIDPSSSVFGKTFKLTLPELIDFSDFLVERTRYDASVKRNWTHRDKCQVWWRNENEEGGSWWGGRILSVKPKSPEFPDSPWERYVIQYRSDASEQHLHSPWELHDPDCGWEHPHIDEESKRKLLSSFAKMERNGQKDYYGIQKLEQGAQKSDFLNRFPVPLSPEVIKKRLENNYYRSLEAVKHDMMVMLLNANSYFGQNAELMAKMRRLSDWIARTLPPS